MDKRVLRFLSALILTIIACVIISAVFVITIRAGIREKLNNVIDVTMNNAAIDFEEKINEDFVSLHNYNNAEINSAVIPSGFIGIGYIDVVNNKYSLDYKFTSAVENNITILFNNTEIDDSDSNIFSLTIEDTSYIVYSLKNGEVYNLFFISETEFSKRINLFSFENIVLINQSEKIIYSTFQTDSAYYDRTLLINNYNYENINDEAKLIMYQQLSSYDIRLVTYTSSDFIHSFIVKTTDNTLLFVSVLMVVVIVACLYLLLLTIRGDYKSLYREGKVYFLKVDNIGKIISKDIAFKNKYDIDNIFEYICDKEEDLNSRLYNGFVTLKLFDKNNQINYINCKSNFDGMFYRLIGNDITTLYIELLETKKKLNCDVVTGLQHDIQFEKDLEVATRKSYFETFAVAVIEIVNSSQLKTMFGNDTFYKMQKIVSDKLLEYYAPQIKVYFNIEDLFVLFADNTIKSDILVSSLNKKLELLQAPIHVNENAINLVCKAGISQITESNHYSGALREAKVALRYAKLSVNKNSAVYDSRIMKSAFAFYETKSSILELINSNKFNIFYQPQYSLTQKKVVGFEALTRFTSPELKNISVQEFFEVAEKNGAIIEMGTAIYERAMEFAKSIEDKNVTISLNVSPIQLLQEGFSEKFLSKYNSLGLKPESICVEITESFLMQSYDDIINKLLILKNNGILIHLDDFGTAYSSMLYLNKLPINALKIDREFVRDILINEYNKTIVSFMIKLSHDLDLSCIIEGVENVEQSDLISELGGEIIQGYYISRAISPEEAIKMLNDENNITTKKVKR